MAIYKNEDNVSGTLFANVKKVPKMDLSGYVTEDELDDALQNKADANHEHRDYVTNNTLTSALLNKSDVGHIHSEYLTADDLDIYATQEFVNDTVNEAITDNQVDLTGYVKTEDLEDYATVSAMNEGLSAKTDVGHEHPQYASVSDIGDYVASAIENALETKQDVLSFDTTPTENSDNPITSGGMYESLSDVNDTISSLREQISNISVFGFTIVPILPTENIDTTKIYLVPKETGSLNSIINFSLVENLFVSTNSTMSYNDYIMSYKINDGEYIVKTQGQLNTIPFNKNDRYYFRIEREEFSVVFSRTGRELYNLMYQYQNENVGDDNFVFNIAFACDDTENALIYDIENNEWIFIPLLSDDEETIVEESDNIFTEYINVDGVWEKLGDTKIDLSNYVKTEDLEEELEDKQDTLNFDTVPTSGSSNPVTSGGIYTALQNISGGGAIAVDSELSSTSENPVQNKIINAALEGKSDANHTHNEYLTSNDLSGYATENYVDNAIPTVPTKTSDLVNDSGFLTTHQDISGKQDTLTFDNTPTQNSNNPVKSGGIYTALGNKVDTTDIGSANGIAELDANGKVPSSQLPSFVDDVIEGYYNTTDGKFYETYESDTFSTEITGETGKIYTDLISNKTYRWSGSAFVEISESLALGETSSTAYRGDRGKTAYDHSQVTSGNPHNVSASDVGLGNVDNTSDLNKPISTATQSALDLKQNALTFDSTPTENSTNPITSGGVYTALQNSGGGGSSASLIYTPQTFSNSTDIFNTLNSLSSSLRRLVKLSAFNYSSNSLVTYATKIGSTSASNKTTLIEHLTSGYEVPLYNTSNLNISISFDNLNSNILYFGWGGSPYRNVSSAIDNLGAAHHQHMVMITSSDMVVYSSGINCTGLNEVEFYYGKTSRTITSITLLIPSIVSS